MPLQKNKIEKEFKTPLGIVRSGIICGEINGFVENKKYENGCSEIFNTNGHNIEIVSFRIKVPLYNGDSLTDSLGWIFRIEKIAEIKDEIEVYCLLDKISDEVFFDLASGEYLDALQVDYDEWTLHIGTEDGEILNIRAENDDWFPPRLKNNVDFHQSITEMKQNGFVTKIPELNKGEKLHIHYLTAYDKRDEKKVNTWLAVDESKRNLENQIGIW
ncbi:MAG: hypothetical protein LBE39_03015 [Flavobacteriaceae bacterium]|jgi:hypothetical protein|nr:hypothetical protein [Flavobacteriaceae bacterium]